MKYLLFAYEFEEAIDYPFGIGCHYSVKWHEIVNVEFFWIDTGFSTYSIDTIHEIQYHHYKDSLDNESNQMSEHDELNYVLTELQKQGLDTPENRAWIWYWVTYNHHEWERYYEQKRAEQAISSTEAVNA